MCSNCLQDSCYNLKKAFETMIPQTLSQQEYLRYSQQMILDDVGSSGQEKLKKARVLCVGLGGLGSPLSLYLAAAGVGTLGIVDHDKVSVSNLHRQILFRQESVSHQKVSEAEKVLSALNPFTRVHAYLDKIDKKNVVDLISQYDIIADCTDNFPTRFTLHDACFDQKKPYVYASIMQFKGYCSLFTAESGSCFHCLFPKLQEENTIHNCNAGGVLGVLPGILGTIQATEILKWILQIGSLLEKRLLIVDILAMRFKEIQLLNNPDCEFCRSLS